MTLMLHVPTLLGASSVHVTKDTLEMEPLVKVLTPTVYHASHDFTLLDINECADITTNNCDSNATCTNTPGSFTCTCNQGYTGNGTTCLSKYPRCTIHTNKDCGMCSQGQFIEM